MAGGALASMLMSIELQPGIFVDLRTALLAISGFFGGPYAAMISGGAALAYRVYEGGGGVWAGSIAIGLASLVGTVGYLLTRRQSPRFAHVIYLGLAVVAVTFLSFTAMPHAVLVQTMTLVGPPVALLSFVATVVSGLVILEGRRRAAERDLLLAALAQAPDFSYVKNTKSQFAAVNKAVAALHGFESPAKMIGKTDFDLDLPDRARKLFTAEQELMTSGVPLLEFEEQLSDKEGKPRWFSTTKVPLRNDDGDFIGLAGVTRDVTVEKITRDGLEASRNLLSYALTEMSDGLAMFDQHGYLVFSNDRYRQSFPLSGEARRPGTHIETILRRVVETREQLTVPEAQAETWIAQTSAQLHEEGEEEVQLFNGRWLHLRTRPTGDGSSMVVVSDVTKLKQAEIELLLATEQLKLLATTDSLTGLVNRRAFDLAIEREVSRSARTQAPLSLLLVDVDRFKAYNDYYGHQAGDECLRAVCTCLKEVLRRPGDLAARYGGEEFTAILPDTEEDGAYHVAEEFRKNLRQLRMPHDGSEMRIVTASVGIATYEAGEYLRHPAELIEKADAALYVAKAAGRDRVNGWHGTSHTIATRPVMARH